MFSLVILAVTVLFFCVISLLSRTDIPKIKGLPEIPGVPIFGNLLQFGSSHARKAYELSKSFGPVFQVRFGTKVSYARC
jgi:phenylacetate 2-hydroxylase